MFGEFKHTHPLTGDIMATRLTRFLIRAGLADVEVGNMPVLNQVSQSHHGRKAFELCKTFDCQQVVGFERLLLPILHNRDY